MSPRNFSPEISAEVVAAHKENRELELSGAQLTWLGHRKQNPVKVMRTFCLACMGGNSAEVRRCTSPACALFPYRLGTNPFHGKAARQC
jgi:hypothetical protein